jgi:tetratricopeptide (TPR) repeat protein
MKTQIPGALSGDMRHKWKFRLILAALASSLWWLAIVGFASTESPTAEDHFHRGNALDDKGDVDGAIAEYREALRLRPDFAEAHYNLGVELRHKVDRNGAIAEYREALRLMPDFAEAHYNLGVELEAQGKRKEALEEYRKACQLAPNDPDPCGKGEKLSGELKQP